MFLAQKQGTSGGIAVLINLTRHCNEANVITVRYCDGRSEQWGTLRKILHLSVLVKLFLFCLPVDSFSASDNHKGKT